MARNPDILQGTAPSPFDEHPTLPFEGFDDSAVSEAGEGTSADTGETVGAAPDAAVTEWKDKKTVDLVYEGVRRRLDVPWDVVKVMGQLNRKHETTAMSPDPLEEELLKLGSAELYLSQKRQELREFDPATAADPADKVGEVQAFIDKVLPSTPEDQRDKFEKDKEILAYLTAPDEFKQETEQLRETAASEFYSKATDDAYPDIKPEMKKLQELTMRETLEAKALETLHAYLPKLGEIPETEEPEQAEQTEEIEQTVQEQLQQLRSQYAELHASRQKKVFGLDRRNPHALNNKAIEAQGIERRYKAAVQAMIAAEIAAKAAAGEKFADEAALNEFIATRTVDEAMALDKETIEQYSKNNGKLGKFINWVAGRKANGEPDPSKLKMFARMSILGVAGAGLVAATVAFGGAPLAAIASGAVASGKLYATFEARGRHNRMKKTPGLLKKEDVIASLQSVENDEIYDPETQELRDRTYGEYVFKKMEHSSDLIKNAANRETNWQKLHATKRLLGAVAIGVGVGVGARMIGHALNGVDAHGASPDVPTPGHPDVPQQTPEWPSAPDVPAPVHNFAPGTFVAHNGDGYYDILQRMGVPAADRHDVLASVTKELSKYSYFQPGDPLPRIPRPGSLPQGAIDILTKAVSR